MPHTLLMELVLQHLQLAAHPWLDSDYAAIIHNLLHVSKSTRQSLALYCAGQVPISAWIRTNQQATLFAIWLRQPTLASSGHIMKSLNFNLRCPDRAAAEAAITAALQQAAAAAPGGRLLLQSFSSSTPTAAILQQLSSSCNITSMDLGFSGLFIGNFPQGPEEEGLRVTNSGMQELGQAFAGLQSLRSLQLTGSEDIADEDSGLFMGADEVLKQLTALTNLTSLKLGYTNEQQCLPPQLQKLTYSGLDIHRENYSMYTNCSAGIDMGHLTALTKLTYHAGCTDNEEHRAYDCLDKYSVLPPNLEVLHLNSCQGFEAVLRLQHLRGITIEHCCLDPEHPGETLQLQLRQLSKLSSLKEVHLICEGEDDAKVAAASWKYIPLNSLSCHIDLEAAAREEAATPEAEAATAQVQGGRARNHASSSGGSSNITDSSNYSMEGSTASSSTSRGLLQQLVLQTGLMQLQLSMEISCSAAEAATQLNLLIPPLQQLTELRRLTLCAANGYHSTASGTSAHRVNISPYRALAGTICALPKLETVALNASLRCTCRGLVPAVRAEMKAAACLAKLELNFDLW